MTMTGTSISAPILPARDVTISQAAGVLNCGGLVAMPTETVYGLAADASNQQAVARLYAAKTRPAFNPLIAHVLDTEMAALEGVFNPDALKLAEAFWPGPLTLVLPLADTHTVCDLARAGLETIALRSPAHPVARALISAFGKPLVAPSANPSGRISPTTAQHVSGDMKDAVDIILDGGPCEIGIESTIIACTSEAPALLRPGGLAMEEIETVLGKSLMRPDTDPNAPSAPGQLLRHYAPRAVLRLNADAPEEGEAYLGFGTGAATLTLSPTSDLTEAAANLFTMLRDLDERHTRIAVAPIPDHGLGGAINDRLARAAKRD